MLGVESAYETAPVPEPPVVVRFSQTLAALVVISLEIVSASCAPRKIKLTGADTACAKELSAAFVAVTIQVAAALASKVAVVNVQFAPETA